MARAVYARKRLAIIDDMLSGLDWATEEFVWDNIFGPRGLLRQHRTTIVLATHKGMVWFYAALPKTIANSIVRHLREADNIIVLGEDGSIIESGTFKSLDLQNGYVQSLFVEKQTKKSATGDESTDAGEFSKSSAVIEVKEETPGNDLLRKTGDFTLYKYYFKSIGTGPAIGILALTTIAMFLQYFPRE